MFQVEFTQSSETQTLGYATLAAAMDAAEKIFRSESVRVVTVTDATNPDEPIIAASWSRG